MPGPLGEVVPKQPTLRIDSVDIRQEPVLWQRKVREVRTVGHREQIHKLLEDWGVPLAAWEAKFGPEITQPWCVRKRLGARVNLQFGHSYDGWWDKYHEQYLDIFALQPSGTRINTNTRERLCKSNPVLWELVAKEKITECALIRNWLAFRSRRTTAAVATGSACASGAAPGIRRQRRPCTPRIRRLTKDRAARAPFRHSPTDSSAISTKSPSV